MTRPAPIVVPAGFRVTVLPPVNTQDWLVDMMLADTKRGGKMRRAIGGSWRRIKKTRKKT